VLIFRFAVVNSAATCVSDRQMPSIYTLRRVVLSDRSIFWRNVSLEMLTGKLVLARKEILRFTLAVVGNSQPWPEDFNKNWDRTGRDCSRTYNC
jgi:hypothetical protein